MLFTHCTHKKKKKKEENWNLFSQDVLSQAWKAKIQLQIKHYNIAFCHVKIFSESALKFEIDVGWNDCSFHKNQHWLLPHLLISITMAILFDFPNSVTIAIKIATNIVEISCILIENCCHSNENQYSSCGLNIFSTHPIRQRNVDFDYGMGSHFSKRIVHFKLHCQLKKYVCILMW